MKKKEEECLEVQIRRECALERIVKVGDPPSKMTELAEIDVDLIMMGRTIKVLRLTSTPVVMFK